MKKVILGLTCFLSAATCFLFACDKAPDIADVKWSNAGITAETLTLPELELDSVKNSSGASGTSITVVWNNAAEANFNALASECYTNIPANKSLFGEDAELSELKSVQTSYCVYTASYKISGDQYVCTVMYFTADVEEANASYKKDQLVLNIEKVTVSSVTHEYWDSIVNSNKTWFTADELAVLGWDGVAAPQGDIMGKITGVDGEDWQIAIENTTKAEFDNFVKNLYDNYIKDNGLYEGQFKDKEYNHEELYFVEEKPTQIRFIVPQYKVGEKRGTVFVVYKDAHIVIMTSVN